MNYEVTREDPSRLTRHRWRFWVHGTRIILDKFYRESRPTTRHKYRWIAPDVYDRTDRRNSLLPVHMVPQPKDIHHEVLRQIVADLRMVVQDRRDVEAPWADTPDPAITSMTDLPKRTPDEVQKQCVDIIRSGQGYVPAAKLYCSYYPVGLKEAMDTLRKWVDDHTATLANDKHRK